MTEFVLCAEVPLSTASDVSILCVSCTSNLSQFSDHSSPLVRRRASKRGPEILDPFTAAKAQWRHKLTGEPLHPELQRSAAMEPKEDHEYFTAPRFSSCSKNEHADRGSPRNRLKKRSAAARVSSASKKRKESETSSEDGGELLDGSVRVSMQI